MQNKETKQYSGSRLVLLDDTELAPLRMLGTRSIPPSTSPILGSIIFNFKLLFKHFSRLGMYWLLSQYVYRLPTQYAGMDPVLKIKNIGLYASFHLILQSLERNIVLPGRVKN
ncbi:unnamed protein product [Musa textilis]